MSRESPLASPGLGLGLGLGVVVVSLVASACGGAEAPPPPAAAPAPAPVAAPPPPDLSEVPAPSLLVVSGRIGKLSASLATVHGWTKLPMPQSEQVSELLTSEAVGAVVDLDQPIDFAVGVTGSGARTKDLTAVSAAVKDPDKVKASLGERYKLVPGDNGALLIQGLGRPSAKDEEDDGDDKPGGDAARTCELAPAFGDAPVRIVCGWSPKALSELGPWLTRTATRAPSTGDLHVDVKMAAIKPAIAEQKRLLGLVVGSLVGGRMGMSSLRELALAVGGDAADFATDLDAAALDVTLTDAGAQASFSLALGGNASTMGRLMTAHADRNGPAPAAFWQLPGDADIAFYGRGMEEADLAKGRDLVLRVLGDVLADQGLKEADRKPMLDALGRLVSPAGGVYGSGVDVDAIRAALAADKAASRAEGAERGEAKHKLVEALLGWRVLEVDDGAGRFTGALKDLSAAVSRPAFVAALRAKSNDTPLVLRTLPVARSAKLPAGTQHYLLELPASPPAVPKATDKKAPPKKPAPVRPVQLHVFVAPDGARTWAGIGGDEATVASRLAAALAPSGDKLGARPELAALKDAKTGSGGFVTARGLPEAIDQIALLFRGSTGRSAEIVDEAAQMPNHGLTPVVFSSTAQAGSPATVMARITVPRGAIEDLVSTVLRHGGF